MRLKYWVQSKQGRLKSLSDFLEKSPAYISHLCAGRKPVPPVLCLSIERFTICEVTRYDLRPQDAHLIWPPEEQRCADCPHDFPSSRDSHDG